MSDDYELQNVTTWRLRELLQHEKDNAALRSVNAELLAMLQRVAAEITLNGLNAAPDPPARDAYIRLMVDVRGAIAKAEGR